MKIAVVGSRNLNIDIAPYIPAYASVIISGGASGVDQSAAKYAHENGLELIEFLPCYEQYGRLAPLRRNDKIVDAADCVLAIWDGKSRGTKYVIDRCMRLGKKVEVVMIR